MRIKPISISLSPNTEKDDVFLAFKLLFQPWKWKKGEVTKELEEQFKNYFNVKYAFSFNSARSCLMAILKDCQGSFLTQAFTCNAASNPAKWFGLNPVYVDAGNDFNIDLEDLKKKITPNSKFLMVQHTFGIPANMEEITKIAEQNNLILIEDCAHSLGAEYKGKKIGTFGKAAFFSFSRDKIISCVYGGVVITNDDQLAEKIAKFQEKIGYPTLLWIKQQLLHPILMNWLIIPTYRIIGKYLLVFFQSVRILSKAVHWREKKGDIPSYFPRRMPNALALLALNQFKKLERFNKHRKEISEFYFKNLIGFELSSVKENTKPVFLRFSVKHKDAHKIIRDCWNKNILIGDWYTSPIAPQDTDLEKMGYKMGSCPNAERLSKITLNLPTHINISQKDAQKIVDLLNKYK